MASAHPQRFIPYNSPQLLGEQWLRHIREQGLPVCLLWSSQPSTVPGTQGYSKTFWTSDLTISCLVMVITTLTTLLIFSSIYR